MDHPHPAAAALRAAADALDEYTMLRDATGGSGRGPWLHRAAVAYTHAALDAGVAKTRVEKHLGVSRPTLNAWLRQSLMDQEE